MEEVLECVICGNKLHNQDQHVTVLHNITQHTCTPLKDIVRTALKRKLRMTDVMCKKCLDLFNEKDRLQKMATDMDSHIMTKIKDSSKKILKLPTAISITVGESLTNDNIKEELERQYKSISLGELNSDNVKEDSGAAPQVIHKKKRGRPRKTASVHNEENTEPPPLMVHERQKRKRSSKFNTFLEVLKGEKDFYIIDEDVEEPVNKRRRGSRKANSSKVDIVSVSDDLSHDDVNGMCIIQLTEMDDHSIALPLIDRDNGKLNLAEVVEEILGIDSNVEPSLIHDIDHLNHDEEDLIKVIDGIHSHHDGKAEDEIVLKGLNLSEDDIDIKEEPLEINSAWTLKDLSRRDRGNKATREKAKLADTSSNLGGMQSFNRSKIEESCISDSSIEVAGIDALANFTDIEVTISQNGDESLCAVINNQDILRDVGDKELDVASAEHEFEDEEKSQDKFRCKVCGRGFPSKESAREHAQRDHKESFPPDSMFKCSDCDKAFPTAKGRDRHHSQMHLKYKPVQCEECNISFNSFRPLERHLRNAHDRYPKLHCKLCEEEFVLESSLKLHSTIGHPTMAKKGSKKPGKTKLIAKIKNNRLFECPLCGKQIFGVRAVKVHHRKHHDNVTYTCKYCKYKSNCLRTYDRHMVKVHKASTLQLYNCVECQKGFHDPRDLEEHHIAIHHAKLVFLCSLCGEKFACMSMLRFHRKSHVAFSCKVCHLGFMKEEALEDHLKTVHVSDRTTGDDPVEMPLNGETSAAGNENIKPDEKENENDNSSKEATAGSKVFVIGSDGSVKIKEDKDSKALANSSSEDVTLHLQQSREGGLEEMDVLNPLKGHRVKDLPKKMNCPVCNKMLTTKFLRTHMLSHKGELPHKCNVCGKSYAQGTLLRKHMKNRHYSAYLKLGNKHPKKQKVTCEFCLILYEDIYSLEEHLWQHMDVKTFECSDCKIKFGMESNLREHYKSHYFKETQSCPVCRREFKSIGYYNEHVEKCQKRWRCDECGLKCYSQEYYRKHQRSKHGGDDVKRYQCKFCDKSFVEKHRYADHVISHSSEKSFICSVCNKQFKRFRPLRDHIVRCHSRGPPSCTHCRITFLTQEELDVHKRTHRRDFPCTSCGHVYTSKEALNNHLMVNHNEANPHNCHICGQSFVKQANLKTHMVTHNASTPNICPVDSCHKMFRTVALLRNHIARRHDELLYVCPICDRKFGLEADQIRHMATHSTKLTSSSQICVLCGNDFKTEALLDRHLLTHSQEKPYECGICHHTASSHLQIARHLGAEHDVIENAANVIAKRWRCSDCGKMFLVQPSLIRHLVEHASRGIHAEGFSVKTYASPSAVSDITSATNTDPANTASAFIDRISTLSWQDITSLLHLNIITEEGTDAKGLPSEVWQCPGCLLTTEKEEDMRDHLINIPACQEAVILHMADGLENSEDVVETSTNGHLSEGGENETVLQLANGEGGLQYVIVQEDESESKFSIAMKEENEEQEDEDSVPILVSMDDNSIQQLLHQPGAADIQIVVEDSAPLKQLLEETEDQAEHIEAVASTSSSSHIQDGLPGSTSLLNGCEVLLQTADGQLLLQETVGGITQYRLVEGVPASSEEEDSSLAVIQPSAPLPTGEFIEDLQSE